MIVLHRRWTERVPLQRRQTPTRLLAYYKMAAATITPHLAFVNSFVFLFVSTAVPPSAAWAVHSVPPLDFDVDELRFWFGFLAASESFFTTGPARVQLLPFTQRDIQRESRPLAGYKTVGALK